jgi:hypothetical protein
MFAFPTDVAFHFVAACILQRIGNTMRTIQVRDQVLQQLVAAQCHG